jgi:hypothetical protein
MPTVRLQDRHHHQGRRIHGVSGAKGSKQDGSLHMFYTLCNHRLEGAGGDQDSNYAEDDEPNPITCKRCQAVLARWAESRDKFLARERERRAATTAACELVAWFETLDVDEVCGRYEHPDDRVALREALGRETAKLRRFTQGRRLELRPEG